MILEPKQVATAWKAFAQLAQVRSPRSEDEYVKLLELMDHLTDQIAMRGETIEDSLYTPLFDLVAAYMREWEEANEPPLEDTPGHLTLKYLMEEHGLSQYGLAKEGIIDQSLLSKILRGERKISKELAKKLGERFHVSPAVFL